MNTDDVTQVPPKGSLGSIWLQWFVDLNSEFGNKTACTLWLKAWAVRGDSNANTLALREYLAKYGIDISGQSDSESN